MHAAIVAILLAQTPTTPPLEFPATGAAAAQMQFIKGVIALHNSSYDDAVEYFQAAQKIDPSFVMAYWGEAMTFNRPFWGEQDIASARRALSKLGATRSARLAKAPTPRERAYLNAAEILYSDGDKDSRDLQFAAAMQKVAFDFPEDYEAAAFSVLAQFGTIRVGDQTRAVQTRAIPVLKAILEKYPDHPGALHYLIHALDNPDNAHLGVEYARRYERVADQNSHALHMPAHIYLQLGLWQDVVRCNQAAFEASDRRVKLKNLSVARRDYHGLEWVMYGEIQLGQYRKARERAALMLSSARQAGVAGMSGVAAVFAARFAVETSEWDALAQFPAGSRTPELLFAQGLAAVANGDKAAAVKAIASINGLIQESTTAGRRVRAAIDGALNKILSARLALSEKNFAEAKKLALEAIQYESTLEFPSDLPDLIKPAYEFYGEILLASNKPVEAAEQFSISLKRKPRRALSLLGLARARAMHKDAAGAMQAYRELAEIWLNADATLPALREVRSFAGNQ